MGRQEQNSSEELMIVESSVKGKKKQQRKKPIKKGVIDYADLQMSSEEEDCLIVNPENNLRENNQTLNKAVILSDNQRVEIPKNSTSQNLSESIVQDKNEASIKENSKDSPPNTTKPLAEFQNSLSVSKNTVKNTKATNSTTSSSVKLNKKIKVNNNQDDSKFNQTNFDLPRQKEKNSSVNLDSQDKISREMIAQKHSELQSTEAKSTKYILRFRNFSFEKDFYLNDNDPLESVYSELFGEDKDKKIIYEGMKLSRFLNAGEAGFFPGLNYIYLPADEKLASPEESFITVKFDPNPDNDVKLKFLANFIAADLYNQLNSMGINTKDRSFVLNGEKLTPNTSLQKILENEYSLDLIDNSLFEDSIVQAKS